MELKEFFNQYPKVAVAFSGGVDSSYLLYAAKQYAQKVTAYYVKSCFQPEFELTDAKCVAVVVDVEMKILSADVLADPKVCENPVNRCYYCKKAVFSTIMKAAREDGYEILLDGTNASDDADDRPGMKALEELSVLSPLRICGLSKDRIRELSKEARLYTWNKPAYACLATRIPAGEEITEKKIADIEAAEGVLFNLGFTDFRVRTFSGHARLQIPEAQTELLLRHRKRILSQLKRYYETVSLDLEAR